MDFNKIWTKEINDECRSLIKKGYNSRMIIEHFGKNITEYHPKKKYTYTKLVKFNSFVNEIKITPGYVYYTSSKKYSNFYKNKIDYVFNFIVNNNKYVFLCMYVENYNKSSYEIVFTTREQYDEYEDYKKNKNKLTLLDEIYLSSIIEEETDRNELIKIIKSLCYIIENEYKNIPYSITETDNKIKIKLYRNIFNDTYKNLFIETKNKSQLNVGKNIYYYEKK